MNGIMSTLRGKIAGVPVWLIVAALAGLGYWFVKRKSSTTADNSQDSASDTPGVFDWSQLANPMPTQSVFYINIPGQDTGGITTGPPAGGAPGGSTNPPGGSPAPGGTPGTPTPPPKKTSITYTVKSGDTLSAIAAKQHVQGGWPAIWQLDKSLITATARQHGYTGDKPYNYIYPGEKLVLPA